MDIFHSAILNATSAIKTGKVIDDTAKNLVKTTVIRCDAM